MFKNLLTSALRSVSRNRFFAILNTFGMTLGITAFLFIYVFVSDELSYDRFHQDAEHVYRVNTYWGDDPENDIYATTPPPLFHAIKDEIPEVEAVARAFWWNDTTMRLPNDKDGKVFRETNVFIVDPNFLKVMDFNLVEGNVETAFSIPESLVLTQETAIRYFGEEAVQNGRVLGETILFGGDKTARKVTAIVNPPANTHFHFDMLVNIQFGYQWFDKNDNWAWNLTHTYLKVFEEVGRNELAMNGLQQKLNTIAQNYGIPFMQAGNRMTHENPQFEYRLQPLTDIHLHSHFLREHEANGNPMVVKGLSIIAVFLLLMAIVNFTNLTTAKASKRAKEMGVRKLLGSGKGLLVGQFLSESVFFGLLSGFLAMGLAEALRLPFNTMIGRHLEFQWLQNPSLILMVIGLSLAVSLLAGLYPAFYLTSFQPLQVLKMRMPINREKAGLLRNGLIVFQFTISIGLTICSILVYQQIIFVQQKELGFEKDRVLVVKNDKEIKQEWEDFKSSLEEIPSIQHVSFSTALPTQPLRHMRDFRLPSADRGEGIHWLLADGDYLTTLGMELVAGRGFSEDFQSDQTGLLLNEAAVTLLDLKQPILGQQIIKNKGEDDEEVLRIIGIIKDFNMESLHHAIKPLAIQQYRPSHLNDFVVIKFSGENIESQVSQMEKAWKRFQPEDPFIYFFLDQSFDALFRSEQQLSKMLAVFTLLNIFIACLGLFGLAAYTAEKRTKEIGIRKVLGASTIDIVLLLSKSFSLLVVLAYFVAIPLAYWSMGTWLENFAYRIEIRLWVFFAAGAIMLLIAWTTVSIQSLKSARMNPAKALRDE